MKNYLKTNWHIFWIIFLQLSSFFVFYFFSSKLSIRLDESQSLWQTSFSLQTLIDSLSQNVHVPLYHLSIHTIQTIFGNSIFVGRLFSFIVFFISIPVFYIFSKYLYDKKVAIFAVTIYGFSPFLIWFSSETRMYTLLILLTIFSHYFFIKLMRSPSTILWIAYFLCGVVGIFSHYFYFLVLFSHIVFFILTFKNNFTKIHFKKFLLISAGLMLSFLPWILKILKGSGTGQSEPLLEQPNSIDVFNVFSNFFFGFQTDIVNSLILSFWPILLILLFLLLNKKTSYKRESVFLIIATFVPIVTAFFLSVFIQPVFLSRYLIVSLPPLFLLIARLMDIYPKVLSLFLKGVLIFFMILFSVIQIQNKDAPTREEYRNAVNFLNKNAKGQDVVIVSAPFNIYPILYYYKGEASINTLPKWNRLIGGEYVQLSGPEILKEQVDDLTENHQKIFLFLSYDQGEEKKIKDYFDENFQQIDKKQYSADVRIFVYQ